MKKTIALCALAFCAVAIQSCTESVKKEPTEQKEQSVSFASGPSVLSQFTYERGNFDFDTAQVVELCPESVGVLAYAKTENAVLVTDSNYSRPDWNIPDRQSCWLSNFKCIRLKNDHKFITNYSPHRRC